MIDGLSHDCFLLVQLCFQLHRRDPQPDTLEIVIDSIGRDDFGVVIIALLMQPNCLDPNVLVVLTFFATFQNFAAGSSQLANPLFQSRV